MLITYTAVPEDRRFLIARFSQQDCTWREKSSAIQCPAAEMLVSTGRSILPAAFALPPPSLNLCLLSPSLTLALITSSVIAKHNRHTHTPTKCNPVTLLPSEVIGSFSAHTQQRVMFFYVLRRQLRHI